MDADLQNLAREEISDLIGRPAFQVFIEPIELMVLISTLQVAMRHPGVTGTHSEKVARAFIEQGITYLAEPGSALESLLRMGDNPIFDVGMEKGPERG